MLINSTALNFILLLVVMECFVEEMLAHNFQASKFLPYPCIKASGLERSSGRKERRVLISHIDEAEYNVESCTYKMQLNTMFKAYLSRPFG